MIRLKFNIKGSAVIEMAVVLLFTSAILSGFFYLFQLAHFKQKALMIRQYTDTATLRQRQLELSILERPCLVHEMIENFCKSRRTK